MDALEAVKKARDLLMDITPMKIDCGRVCGAACCSPDEDGQGGMLLFPGEERLYDPLPEGFEITENDDILPGMKLLTCDGGCSRGDRPLSCRIFPLTPVIDTKNGTGEIGIIVDPRSFCCCPLSASGVMGMRADFAAAVKECADLLCQCKEHRDYFKALGQYFDKLRQEPGD